MSSPAKPLFVLVPSPFLGAQSWDAVAQVLEARGERRLILDVSQALDAGDDPYQAVGRLAARRIRAPGLLVLHSGAGGLAPTIFEGARGLAKGAVFVDALLPHPGRSWFDTAPDDLARRLRAGVVNGRAPPWSRWVGAKDLARLVPDAAMRRGFAERIPGVPLAYLQAAAPEVQGWPPLGGGAYLQLSPAYRPQADQASAWNWPVARLQADHLGIMTRPELVATSIAALAASLSVTVRGS